MFNEIVRIKSSDADAIAEAYFRNICGFDRGALQNGAKVAGMLRQGLDVREKLRGRIDIRAVVSAYDGSVISGNAAKIDSVEFACSAFEQLDREHIGKIYAFIMAAGSFELEDAPMIDEFYADAWGTAYVDAGRDILRSMIRVLEEESPSVRGTPHVSDSFGPGFYGMELEQVAGFFKILDADAIMVKLNASNCMLPLKSCAGFYIVVDDAGQLPPDGCKSCIARDKGCSYCGKWIRDIGNTADAPGGDLA